MDTDNFAEELAELESAEDFLAYFGINFEPAVVQVNRLHILQRFHDYLEGQRRRGAEPGRAEHRELLARAYADFVHSDAYAQKVMRVHQKASGIAKVSLDAIGRARP